jgi:hypothetical protein
MDLFSGILLICNVVLTIAALIRGWKWKGIIPICFGILFTFITAMVAGLFIGTIFSVDANIFLVGVLNILFQTIVAIVLLYMFSHVPTPENIDFMKFTLRNLINKLKLKQTMIFLGFTFIIWFFLCVFKGLLGVEGKGNIYNFLLIISAVLSGVILKVLKKTKSA